MKSEKLLFIIKIPAFFNPVFRWVWNRGLLPRLPRYGEKCSGRKHGFQFVRRHTSRYVRHPCVHRIYFRQSCIVRSQTTTALCDGKRGDLLHGFIPEGASPRRRGRALFNSTPSFAFRTCVSEKSGSQSSRWELL